MTDFRYELIGTDPATRARRGRVHTRRGVIETPVFMPVGTQATVKTLEPHEVAHTGAQIVLANTYHLMLRPGVEIVRGAGGVHAFSRWHGPILTDSGGFQIFSLASQVKVREEGASFRSHIDGSHWHLTPERAIELQAGYRSDIMMALDHVVGYPARERAVAEAMHRTHRWLDRCIARTELGDLAPEQGVLFGIVQGGMFPELRTESAQQVAGRNVAGCAIGGLSVGEPKDVMAEFLDLTMPHLPDRKPRYLMGVGSPEDLWNGVAQGVDMFDCVLPTRLARNAALFTLDGRINIRKRHFRDVLSAGRRRMRLPHLPELHCRLPSSPLSRRRNPRPEAGHHPQHPVPGPSDGDHARGNLVRHIRSRAPRIPRSVQGGRPFGDAGGCLSLCMCPSSTRTNPVAWWSGSI